MLCRSTRTSACYIAALITAFLASVLAVHNVPTDVTDGDRLAIKIMLGNAGYDGTWWTKIDLNKFDDQVTAVIAIQHAVFAASPNDESIPLDVSREPMAVLALGMGYCFDRSRVIEKMFTVIGLKTRHAALYSSAETGSRLTSLLTPHVGSHAVSEVKTRKGWIIVDSTRRWISLTDKGRPISLAELRILNHDNVAWSNLNTDPINVFLKKDFTYLIGLYSRHGRFFPPYTPLPDVNWADFATGLIGTS